VTYSRCSLGHPSLKRLVVGRSRPIVFWLVSAFQGLYLDGWGCTVVARFGSWGRGTSL
jgi:hypothetical protein